MKLSSDERRAVAFVLGLVALAGVARFAARPASAPLPAGASMDMAALERASEQALQKERAAARPLGAEERIDVNGAGAEELDRLPGVGPGLAARLVAERERAGAFDSAADLRAVPGVGAALVQRLAPHLAFGPGVGLARRTPAAAAAERESAGAGARDRAGNRDRAEEPATGTRGRRRAGSAPYPEDAAVARSPARPLSRTTPAAEPLELNRASAAELEALPGIGPALAARIVAKRDSLRGFRGVDELVKVRGIGPATLARLRPLLR